MKKNGYQLLARGFLAAVNLAAAAVLAAELMLCAQSGYSQETWKDVIQGRTDLESEQYAQQASDAIYGAVQAAARSSRMEKDGSYDSNRIIRIPDYLRDRTVYDTTPPKGEDGGICYRMEDLYQWSLQGPSIQNRVLQELYHPIGYGSIQDYAKTCDESYNVVVSQVLEAMEILKKDVADYQQAKKDWAYGTVNVRYALQDLGNGRIYTNVPELQGPDTSREDLDGRFFQYGSYYRYDSRTGEVRQQDIGEFYSYNTHSLLTDWNVHLEGEYQVYVGIDTSFPVVDQMARQAEEYEQARMFARSHLKTMAVCAAVLLLTFLYLCWKFTEYIGRMAEHLFLHSRAAVRIVLLFGAYELVQALLFVLFGKGMVAGMVLLLYNLVILGLLIWEEVQRDRLLQGVQALASGEEGETSIPTEHLSPGSRQMAEAVNNLGEGLKSALQEQMKSERMKAALITNVSHDLKTPLTSIINYVDLMKREKIDNPKAQEYLKVLDQKSQRLKQLTEDLVEASRASSGNVTLEMHRIDLKELLLQTSGEFAERFAARGLTFLASYPETPLCVEADGRRLWRIIENLYRNVEKYAMPYTRVYLDLSEEGGSAVLSMKNISEQPLNISAEELTERFTRGDESRSTEGSGLGLSIAKDLTELQKGTFSIYLDGDLFKVTMTFPKAEEKVAENN